MKSNIYLAKHFRYLVIVLCILLNGFSHQAKAQLVLVPDSNFRNALIAQGFGSCFTGNNIDSTCSQVINCSYLNISAKNIFDLTGIEAFHHVTNLNCRLNYINLLPALPDFLDTLDCSINQIPTLPTLPPTLSWLSCSYNQLTSFPVMPNAIRYLFFQSNNVTALPSLPPDILYIGCSSNKITSITTLPDSLLYFCADGNLINSLPTLPVKLSIINISFTPITTLPALPATLYELTDMYGQLTSLPALPSALYKLNCPYNQLTSLPSLPSSMAFLDCSHNNISSLPPLSSGLTTLKIGFNQPLLLPSIPPTVRYLYCDGLQLTTLPPLPFGLREFVCNNNLLTAIPVMANSVYQFECAGNLLTSLPTLPDSLKSLNCSYNQLTTLPTLPTKITSIDCSSNNLTSLPSLPTSLTVLFCPYNDLSSLPDLPAYMSYLDCHNNPNITCLPKLTTISNLDFSITNVQCIPNFGQVQVSNPNLSNMPLCDIFNNPYNCPIYWNVSGFTFQDSDSDCVFNNSDSALTNLKVNLSKNGIADQSAITNKSGWFAFDTDLDNYSATLDTVDLPYNIKCPLSGIYADTLTVLDSLKNDNLFSLECKAGFDLAAWSIYSLPFVPGKTNIVKIAAGDIANYYNGHCAFGIGGTVKIVITGTAIYSAPAAGALTPSVNADTLTYTVSDFGLIDGKTAFNFLLVCDVNSVIGKHICIDVTVLPSADNLPLNNTNSSCIIILGSYDPNNKSSNPETNLDIYGNHWLTYTINYQNTGTYAAENIYIVDTLDSKLDLSTFQLLSYDHQPFVQMLTGGIVKFNLPQIYLPDSTSNEPESHGYFQYKIKAKNNVVVNQIISNTAYIYFDFNSPIQTNTVSNEVVDCNQSIVNISQLHDTLAASISGATYQWINCTSGNIIAGATAQSFVPTSSGDYAVIVSAGSCVDTSSCHYISLTGISKNFTSDITVSPNPSNDAFVVNCPQNIIGNNLSLKVFDAYGKLIEQKQIVSDNTILNATNWSKGIYFLELNIFGNTTVRKLIKE